MFGLEIARPPLDVSFRDFQMARYEVAKHVEGMRRLKGGDCIFQETVLLSEKKEPI